ncbi:hypothetical protein CJO82_20605 (plasmid) [Ralstonia solanacearum]|nr:hypothetical protein CJO82_20605 [Ralstonia solanacearum]AXW26034.1 hypothetical protein CJO86_20870 [Ralstonia solanacearum]AXW64170.1 hypothetical protein CJO94_20815 [Ralstonia solanacearum]AXW82944.1 hypothetical protein CJO98_20965 [Ralstonia solanacearum]
MRGYCRASLLAADQNIVNKRVQTAGEDVAVPSCIPLGIESWMSTTPLKSTDLKIVLERVGQSGDVGIEPSVEIRVK